MDDGDAKKDDDKTKSTARLEWWVLSYLEWIILIISN